MEASEKIVEAYMRSVKKCLTIANVKCRMNKEIDLLAIDPQGQRYHVESTISTSPAYSKLTNKNMQKGKSPEPLRRRTLGFFQKEKFNHPIVVEALRDYGFTEGNYKKVIISMRVTDEVIGEAKNKGIEVWLFRDILNELFEATDRSQYLSDEARLFQLIGYWMKGRPG